MQVGVTTPEKIPYHVPNLKQAPQVIDIEMEKSNKEFEKIKGE